MMTGSQNCVFKEWKFFLDFSRGWEARLPLVLERKIGLEPWTFLTKRIWGQKKWRIVANKNIKQKMKSIAVDKSKFGKCWKSFIFFKKRTRYICVIQADQMNLQYRWCLFALKLFCSDLDLDRKLGLGLVVLICLSPLVSWYLLWRCSDDGSAFEKYIWPDNRRKLKPGLVNESVCYRCSVTTLISLYTTNITRIITRTPGSLLVTACEN